MCFVSSLFTKMRMDHFVPLMVIIKFGALPDIILLPPPPQETANDQ